jgi:hypothetical protein
MVPASVGPSSILYWLLTLCVWPHLGQISATLYQLTTTLAPFQAHTSTQSPPPPPSPTGAAAPDPATATADAASRVAASGTAPPPSGQTSTPRSTGGAPSSAQTWLHNSHIASRPPSTHCLRQPRSCSTRLSGRPHRSPSQYTHHPQNPEYLVRTLRRFFHFRVGSRLNRLKRSADPAAPQDLPSLPATAPCRLL